MRAPAAPVGFGPGLERGSSLRTSDHRVGFVEEGQRAANEPLSLFEVVPRAAVPSLIAGQPARVPSLFDIALGYGALAALACVMTLVRARNPRTLASS